MPVKRSEGPYFPEYEQRVIISLDDDGLDGLGSEYCIFGRASGELPVGMVAVEAQR